MREREKKIARMFCILIYMADTLFSELCLYMYRYIYPMQKQIL